MKFGMDQTKNAVGGVLAHSLGCGKERLRKGKVLNEKDVRKLIRFGYHHVAVARLEDHDTEENLAATRVAENIHFVAEPENFKKKLLLLGVLISSLIATELFFLMKNFLQKLIRSII